MGFLRNLYSSTCATATLPIVNFADSSGSIAGSLGVAVPASVLPKLSDLGLFSHKAAEKIAKSILEPNGPTLTSHWMDGVKEYEHLYPKGVQLGWHRTMHGHHFITDFFHTLTDKNLSCIDFCKHLGTDIVTKRGLPILPPPMVQSVTDTLGISVSQVAPWISINILETASSFIAIGHAASNVIDVLGGTAIWSNSYVIDTIGVGAVEIVSGLALKNPLLLVSGCADVVCGTITAIDYYSQPFFCGVPIVDILQNGIAGGTIAALITATDLILNGKKYTPSEKIKLLAGRIGLSGFISSMSVICAPAAITIGGMIAGYKVAAKLAEVINREQDDYALYSEATYNRNMAYMDKYRQKVLRSKETHCKMNYFILERKSI